MSHYYNDTDPFACEWLGNLIAAGELPGGTVDNRSITEVLPDDLEGFAQCHFFAGVGGWPLALNLAGWPASVSVWSGSCPCQPFSQAGKQLGEDDPRHLWPHFFRLIRECRPDTVFGEQVANAIGHGWLDGISADLEGEGYAVGAVVLGAHSVGAPHIRQRLFWVADTDRERAGSGNSREQGDQAEHRRNRFTVDGETDGLGNTNSGKSSITQEQSAREKFEATARTSGHYIHCRDGKTRRVPDPVSGIQPLAHGIPRKLGPPLTGMGPVGIRAARANRVGRLRGYGNAIMPTLTVEFIRAYMEISGTQDANNDEDTEGADVQD